MKLPTLVWLLVSLTRLARSQDVCEGGRQAQNVRFTFTSKRNETGNHQTQIRITRSDGQNTSRLPWKVDIEQGVSGCGQEKIRYVQSTYTDYTYSAQDYQFYPLLGRYKLHTTPRTWFEAFQVCQEEGGHLAVINSDEEAHILKEMLQISAKSSGQGYTAAFIGFSDLVKEGSYVTVLGTSLSEAGYSKFAPGEPNNLGGSATNPGQDCGGFYKETGLLDDSACTAKIVFFCEQETE